MAIFKKTVSYLILMVMLFQSFGLWNFIVSAEENAENIENKTVTEVIVENPATSPVEGQENNKAVTEDFSADLSGENTETEENVTANNILEEEKNEPLESAPEMVAMMSARSSTSAGPLAANTSTVLEDLRITVEVKNPDGSEKLDYLSGEPMRAFAGFTLTDTSSTLRNTKLRIKIPKENINIMNIGSFKERDPVRTDDSDNYIATWNFDSVTGGQLADVPFVFNFIQREAPEWFQVPVTAEFLDESGNVIRSVTKTFTSHIADIDYTPSKYIYDAGKDVKIIDGKQVTIHRIQGTTTDVQTHTPAGDEAPSFWYTIALNYKKPQYGYIEPIVRIVEKLPIGAVMAGTPDADGKYNGWTYDMDTHTALYEWKMVLSGEQQWTKNIRLSFPNQPYATVHENRAEITVFPGGLKEKNVGESSAYLKMEYIPLAPVGRNTVSKFVKNPDRDETPYQGRIYYFDDNTQSEDKPVEWALIAGNTNNRLPGVNTFNFHDFVDEALNNIFFYKSVQFKIANNPHQEVVRHVQQHGYKVIGIKADNSEELIKNVTDNIEQEVLIDDVNDIYEKIVIELNQPIRLDNQNIEFSLTTLVKSSIYEMWKETQEDGWEYDPRNKRDEKIIYNNYLRVKNGWRNDTTTAHQYTAEGRANFLRKAFQVMSWNGDNYDFVYTGEKDFYMKNIINTNSISSENENKIIPEMKHITLLPEGVRYNGDGKIIACRTCNRDNITIETIDNFKNLGKTAIIMTLKDVPINDNITIQYNIRGTIHMKVGANNLDSYLIWNDDEIVSRGLRKDITNFQVNHTYGKEEYIDVLDLDNDGNTTEKFLHGVNTITFTPPREIIITKQASVDGNNWFFNAPLADMGADAYFKIAVFNNSITDRRGGLTVLDTLPYVGDHKIVPEENGTFLPRESVFPVTISESLESNPLNAEVLKKWSVFYTTDAQDDSIESVRDANYVTADKITDFTKVKSIKLILDGVLPMGATDEFILKTKLPKNSNLEHGARTVNSTAFSYNDTDFAEGNFATLGIIKYVISGKVFTDTDKNGNNTDVDTPLSGYVITLVGPDGNPILNDKKQPITTTSRDDGSYEIPVYARGEYGVKITKKSAIDEITHKHTELGTTGNDAEQDGTTERFTISPEKPSATRNFGFVVNRWDIALTKKNTAGELLAGVTFRLEKDGQKIGDSQKTNAEGKIFWNNLELGTYQIIEESTLPEYQLDARPVSVTISADTPSITKEIINQKQNWNVKIIKKNIAGERLEGAVFELRENNATGRIVRTGTTDVRGELSFENILYGNYVLVEKEAPRGYVVGWNIAITADKFTKKSAEIIQEVVNQKQLWNLQLTKKNPEWNPLSGATFELRTKDNVLIATKTSDKEWKFSFENLEYQDYTLIEKEAPAGYNIMSPLAIPKETFVKEKRVIEMDVLNTQQKWNLKIKKTTEDNQLLAGVTFELRSGTVDGPIIATKTTNQAGEIIFNDLTYNGYVLVETLAPAMYELHKPIVVGLDAFDKNLTDIEIPVINKKQLWNVVVNKTADDNSPLSGATFALYKDNQNGEKISEKTSDDAGKIIFDNLEYAKYVLVETSAPNGYIISEPVIITPEQFTRDKKDIITTVVNKKQLWNVKILKTDDSGQRKLANAKFVLKNDAGNIISEEKTTNTEGEVIFENISLGNYLLTEVSSPAGYHLLEAPIKITPEQFIKDASEVLVKVKNSPVITYTSGGCHGSCGATPTPPPATVPEIPAVPEVPVTIVEEKPSFTMEFSNPVEPQKGETPIVKYPKRMPRTGQILNETVYKKVGIVGNAIRKQLETTLNSEDFRLAGSMETKLDFWKQVLPEEDKNAHKYIVIPSVGLVMPINSVSADSKEYQNFIYGKNEDFAQYLETGSVELPTSTRGYGEIGNKVIGWHSSYWKNSAGRYKTHFQQIISLSENQEVWIYEKNSEGKFTRFVYKITKSENRLEKDISALKPTDDSRLTLFTCTPIGGITGRWIVESVFIGKYAE